MSIPNLPIHTTYPHLGNQKSILYICSYVLKAWNFESQELNSVIQFWHNFYFWPHSRGLWDLSSPKNVSEPGPISESAKS